MREQLAFLRAFKRKLTNLHTEALEKCETARLSALRLEQSHPVYPEEYMANYERGLRESGIAPEKVGFMHYIQETLQQ
jgi:hypothetical protein